MKARIFSIFRSKKYNLEYWYHDTKKYHDDVEDISKNIFYTPMMEIRLIKKCSNSLMGEYLDTCERIVFASPEVIKKYTGFEIFNEKYFYSFNGRTLDIDFEWEEGMYPYISCGFRDYITTEKYEFPLIKEITKTPNPW